MDICFVLPGVSTSPSGGFKIVFEYANRLVETDDNINVTICFLSDPTHGKVGQLPIPQCVKYLIRRVIVHTSPKWFRLNPSIRKKCIPAVTNRWIPDGQWVFATAISTAYDVHALVERKGRKGYLIQDYEIWDADKEYVCSSYALGMKNVVVSHWLKEIVDEHSPEPSVCIPNPIDVNVFFRDPMIRRSSHQVALLFHEGQHKGWRYAWDAIRLAREQIEDLTVWMFGIFNPPPGLPDWVTYTKDASEEQLRTIYSQSSVYVCASIDEGFALTCVEAMACGCALIVSDFAGSKEYAKQGFNALVSPSKDVTAMAENLVKVLDDESLRKHLSKNGVLTASSRSWDSAVEAFHALLCE